MYLVIALHKFVNEEQTGMRWTWKKCIMHSISEMNDVGVEVYTNWWPLQRWHRRFVTRLNETFLKAPSAKHLMPPFFRKYPDDMMHLKVVEFVPPWKSFPLNWCIAMCMIAWFQRQRRVWDRHLTKTQQATTIWRKIPWLQQQAKESYLKRYGLKCISMSTIVRWIHVVGFRYQNRAKHYFVDVHEKAKTFENMDWLGN